MPSCVNDKYKIKHYSEMSRQCIYYIDWLTRCSRRVKSGDLCFIHRKPDVPLSSRPRIESSIESKSTFVGEKTFIFDKVIDSVILSHLCFEDLYTASRVSKSFLTIVRSEPLWRLKAEREFIPLKSATWKETVLQEYIPYRIGYYASLLGYLRTNIDNYFLQLDRLAKAINDNKITIDQVPSKYLDYNASTRRKIFAAVIRDIDPPRRLGSELEYLEWLTSKHRRSYLGPHIIFMYKPKPSYPGCKKNRITGSYIRPIINYTEMVETLRRICWSLSDYFVNKPDELETLVAPFNPNETSIIFVQKLAVTRIVKQLMIDKTMSVHHIIANFLNDRIFSSVALKMT